MAEQSFDAARIAESTVVIVAMLFAVAHVLPVLINTLYAIVPPALTAWFIVLVLRGIIRGVLP